MESEDWLRNCGPYSWIGRHDRRDLEIDPDPDDEMGERWNPGKVTSASEAQAYADATNDNIVTLMTSPGMLTKLGATVSTNPWQLWSRSYHMCVSSIEYVSRSAAALKSTHESCLIMTPSTLWRGKCCENLCCHHLVSPTLFITPPTSEFISTAPPGPE